MENTTEYEIGNINTLVDLNRDLTNFIAEFKIIPSEEDISKPYRIAVVDQTQIDNSSIDFKDVNGITGATVEWAQNTYKNHYIALKSDSPLKVKVVIDLKELPKVKDLEIQQISSSPNDDDIYENEEITLTQETSLIHTIWFKGFVVVVLLIIGFLIYNRWFKKSELLNSNPLSVDSVLVPVSVSQTVPPVGVSQTVPPVGVSQSQTGVGSPLVQSSNIVKSKSSPKYNQIDRLGDKIFSKFRDMPF